MHFTCQVRSWVMREKQQISWCSSWNYCFCATPKSVESYQAEEKQVFFFLEFRRWVCVSLRISNRRAWCWYRGTGDVILLMLLLFMDLGMYRKKHLSCMCFLHEAEAAPGEGWYHKTRWGISEILGPCETAHLFHYALFEQKNKEMNFFSSIPTSLTRQMCSCGKSKK